MTLMLAAASICTTDMLERHLVPPGFECCEREFWEGQNLEIDGCANSYNLLSDLDIFPEPGKNTGVRETFSDWI